ncbi:hypothetical protein ACRAWB_08985 [Leifsonia poae]|uniref:hypothetical protein n=1 Tax=Leifsonia poae TaxID=110933 RepID=UPI003D6908AD
MTNSTRLRFGVLAAAAAVVAAGVLTAVPANAATTGTITLANTTYTSGSWGDGLDVTGSGFTADSVVTITVDDSTPATIDTHTVTADATGAFHEIYEPDNPLVLTTLGTMYSVSATSDQGDDSNTVALTVLLPKGIATDSPTISTADLADSNKGVSVAAAGYTPGERVTVSVDYQGRTLKGGTYTASAEGAVSFKLWLIGTAVPGPFVITVTGATSGVAQSVTVQVTGDTTDNGDDGDTTDNGDEGDDVAPAVGGNEVPAPAPAATQGAKNLPVVSG